MIFLFDSHFVTFRYVIFSSPDFTFYYAYLPPDVPLNSVVFLHFRTKLFTWTVFYRLNLWIFSSFTHAISFVFRPQPISTEDIGLCVFIHWPLDSIYWYKNWL